jgi:hypothetical protein
MRDKKQDLIDQKLQDLNNDGVDRRGFLKCMAWAGVRARAATSASCRSATATSASTNLPIRTLQQRCRRRSAKSMPCQTNRISSFTPAT